MKELVEMIAKAIVDSPDKVEVSEKADDIGYILKLVVASDDMGKVIGKQGKNAKAIRTVIKAYATKINKKVMLEIESRN